MLSVVKLWRYNNMTYVRMIADLLDIFNKTLSEAIPALQGEIYEFERACKTISENGKIDPYAALTSPNKLEVPRAIETS